MSLELFSDIPPASKPVKGGYAGRPGEGPEGETCGTCRHARRTEIPSGRRYWKCMHGRGRGDTSCDASDIRKGSPACQFWQEDV